MGTYNIFTKRPGALIFVCLGIIIAAISPLPASAADYYVKTPMNGGSNAKSGLSWDTPKATIGAAMAMAGAGDNIFVAAGTYNEKVSFPQGDNIALRGGFPASGQGTQDPVANPTIIDGSGISSAHPMIKIPFQSSTVNGYYGIVIEGFTIRNGIHTGTGCGGIESYSLGVTIKRNIIENNHATGSSSLAGGIYIFGPLNDTGKTIIEQNIIRNNSAAAVGGIYLEGAAGAEKKYFIYLVNNLIIGNQSTTTNPAWQRGTGGIDVMYPAAVSIVNSTISDNTALHPTNAIPGISLMGYSASEKAGASIANSIIWHSGGKDISTGSDSSLWVSFSCINDTAINGTGVIHTPPRFSDETGYQLAQDSPCRNTAGGSGTILAGSIRTPVWTYLPGIGWKNPPYNYSNDQVTMTWGDGANNLTAQWQYYRFSGSAAYGKFFGTDNATCNADPSAGIALGESIPENLDASSYAYRSNYFTAKRDPFQAKETVFWRGTNNYYGAWRIDGIAATRYDNNYYGRLSGVWYFQTNGSPYFDSGIRPADLRGVSRPAETGYDMGAYEYWEDTEAPQGGITINGGAVCTNVMNVVLTLSASDPSGVAEMRFSNDNIAWSEPEPFSDSRSWELPAGYGTKTVYAKFKDSIGNWSDPVTDTIAYPAPGDFNNSEQVDLADIIFALQVTAGIPVEDPSVPICADTNSDNKIDIHDIMMILQDISQ